MTNRTINLYDGLEDERRQPHTVGPDLTYTNEDVLNAIRRVAKDVGENPTLAQYESAESVPCKGTVMERFGSWVKAKEIAGVGGNLATVNVNESYFKKLDSREKAYWLGLIVADGSIIENGDYGGLSTVLELHESDSDTVEKFKKEVESGHTISKIESSLQGASTHHRISITNKQFSQHLIELGLEKNKSQTNTLPTIPPKYRPSFLRGYSDGDGGISIYKHHGSMTGEWTLSNKSEQRLQTMLKWIRHWGVTTGNITDDMNGVSTLTISNEEDLQKIWRTMYAKGENTEPSMQRKTNKFEQLMEVIE